MDIESNRFPVRRRFNKGWELLGKYKRHVLGVLVLGLEMVSLVLDILGNTKLIFVLGALLLSVVGFGVTLCTCINERIITGTRLQAERQLGVVEIAFSVVQLVGTIVHFVLARTGVKENFSAVSLFPLVFAITVVVSIFKKPSSSNHLGESTTYASDDWRSFLQHNSRPRVIKKITDSILDFEKQTYLTASSQADYVQKLVSRYSNQNP